MKYAVVAGGLVENIILLEAVDSDIEEAFESKQLIHLEPDSPVALGWAYASGEFLAPQTPPEPTRPAPRVVTMRQARLALLEAGKLAAVGAAIATLTSPEKDAAQIEWEYAATVDRDSPLMGLLGATLQLDEAELDALFSKAASL